MYTKKYTKNFTKEIVHMSPKLTQIPQRKITCNKFIGYKIKQPACILRWMLD